MAREERRDAVTDVPSPPLYQNASLFFSRAVLPRKKLRAIIRIHSSHRWRGAHHPPSLPWHKQSTRLQCLPSIGIQRGCLAFIICYLYWYKIQSTLLLSSWMLEVPPRVVLFLFVVRKIINFSFIFLFYFIVFISIVWSPSYFNFHESRREKREKYITTWTFFMGLMTVRVLCGAGSRYVYTPGMADSGWTGLPADDVILFFLLLFARETNGEQLKTLWKTLKMFGLVVFTFSFSI